MNYASSDDEAQTRYDKYRDSDPFPSIAPALLNSADIIEYVIATGMLFPFREVRDSVQKLKPASYEADILGEYSFWDGTGTSHRGILKEGQPFVLAKNSIAFVQVEPNIRLPHYLAARFNLAIHHVHRGLLLGTGPLIDPGFAGKILIPLHNLTSDDYELFGGDSLIAIEFTKITWPPPGRTRSTTDLDRSKLGKFHEFPRERLYRQPRDYLRRASGGQPIRSSIPVEVAAAKQAAESASKYTKVVGVALIVALLALAGSILNLMWNATTFVQKKSEEVEQRIAEVERSLRESNAHSKTPTPGARNLAKPPTTAATPISESGADEQGRAADPAPQFDTNSNEPRPEIPE
jgi:deoxycytidine triphosphate deaminase